MIYILEVLVYLKLDFKSNAINLLVLFFGGYNKLFISIPYEALLILKFMPYKSCLIVSKVILSAMSNAKSNFGLSNESFRIVEARVDDGPFMKRFCPHAQGRGFPIKKRMSHIVS